MGGTSSAWRRRAADALCAVALAAAALAWFSLTWDRIIDTRDEGYLLSLSEQVARGAVPHRDFADVYGPAVLPLTGLALEAADGRILGMHVFVGAIKALAVVLGFLAARLVVPRAWAAASAVAAIGWWGRFEWNLNTPYAAVYSVPILTLALIFVLVALRRPTKSRAWLFAAGLVSGGGLLFKQSLGAMGAFALGLALLGSIAPEGANDARAGRADSRRDTVVLAGLWVVAAVALIWPVRAYLNVRDVLVHLAPIYAGMALVAIASLGGGRGPSLPDWLRHRILPFAVGFAVVPLATAALYAGWGALGRLGYDMFVEPTTRLNYARPIVLPSPPAALAALGLASGLGGALLALRGARRGALLAAAAGALAVGGGVAWAMVTGRSPLRMFLGLPTSLEGLQLAVIGWLALAVCGSSLRSRSEATRAWGRLVVPVVFFHLFLCFQGFPRAGPDIHIVQGAQMIALIVVLFGAARALGPFGSRARRGTAIGLLFTPLVLLLAPVVHEVVTIPPGREVRLPRAQGITLAFGAIDQLKLVDLELLVDWLTKNGRADAPIFVLGNEELIYYVTGRPPLFPERRADLFWMGWEMLPPDRIRALDEDEMIATLRAHPEALVVDNWRYLPAGRKRRDLSRVWAFLKKDYEVVSRFGAYRVFGSRAASADPASRREDSTS